LSGGDALVTPDARRVIDAVAMKANLQPNTTYALHDDGAWRSVPVQPESESGSNAGIVARVIPDEHHPAYRGRHSDHAVFGAFARGDLKKGQLLHRSQDYSSNGLILTPEDSNDINGVLMHYDVTLPLLGKDTTKYVVIVRGNPLCSPAPLANHASNTVTFKCGDKRRACDACNAYDDIKANARFVPLMEMDSTGAAVLRLGVRIISDIKDSEEVFVSYGSKYFIEEGPRTIQLTAEENHGARGPMRRARDSMKLVVTPEYWAWVLERAQAASETLSVADARGDVERACASVTAAVNAHARANPHVARTNVNASTVPLSQQLRDALRERRDLDAAIAEVSRATRSLEHAQERARAAGRPSFDWQPAARAVVNLIEVIGDADLACRAVGHAVLERYCETNALMCAITAAHRQVSSMTAGHAPSSVSILLLLATLQSIVCVESAVSSLGSDRVLASAQSVVATAKSSPPEAQLSAFRGRILADIQHLIVSLVSNIALVEKKLTEDRAMLQRIQDNIKTWSDGAEVAPPGGAQT
jgi:hypothetical protein